MEVGTPENGPWISNTHSSLYTVSMENTPKIRGAPFPFVAQSQLVGDGFWDQFTQRH